MSVKNASHSETPLRQVAALVLAGMFASGLAAFADEPTQTPPAKTAETAAPPSRPNSTRPPTLVRAGDRVRAIARVGSVEAVMVAIAEQSGVAQQIIRVVNPDSRRAIRVRVVAAGEVEVVNAQ